MLGVFESNNQAGIAGAVHSVLESFVNKNART